MYLHSIRHVNVQLCSNVRSVPSTQALKRYEDVALAESERIVTDVDSLVEQFAVNKPMEIVLEVQLAPQVVWKGAYTGFTVSVMDGVMDGDSQSCMDGGQPGIEKQFGGDGGNTWWVTNNINKHTHTHTFHIQVHIPTVHTPLYIPTPTVHPHPQVEVEDLGGEEAVTAQVDERLAKELKDSAQLRVVTGRGVGRGDVAIIDAKVQLKKEDGGLELISDRSKMRMDMETADVDFLPGALEGGGGMTIMIRRRRVYSPTLLCNAYTMYTHNTHAPTPYTHRCCGCLARPGNRGILHCHPHHSRHIQHALAAGGAGPGGCEVA